MAWPRACGLRALPNRVRKSRLRRLRLESFRSTTGAPRHVVEHFVVAMLGRHNRAIRRLHTTSRIARLRARRRTCPNAAGTVHAITAGRSFRVKSEGHRQQAQFPIGLHVFSQRVSSATRSRIACGVLLPMEFATMRRLITAAPRQSPTELLDFPNTPDYWPPCSGQREHIAHSHCPLPTLNR